MTPDDAAKRAADDAQVEETLMRDIHAATEAALKADREAALRDVFAAAALSGIAAYGRWTPEASSRLAFEFADAMIAERKKAAST